MTHIVLQAVIFRKNPIEISKLRYINYMMKTPIYPNIKYLVIFLYQSSTLYGFPKIGVKHQSVFLIETTRSLEAPRALANKPEACLHHYLLYSN